AIRAILATDLQREVWHRRRLEPDARAPQHLALGPRTIRAIGVARVADGVAVVVIQVDVRLDDHDRRVERVSRGSDHGHVRRAHRRRDAAREVDKAAIAVSSDASVVAGGECSLAGRTLRRAWPRRRTLRPANTHTPARNGASQSWYPG